MRRFGWPWRMLFVVACVASIVPNTPARADDDSAAAFIHAAHALFAERPPTGDELGRWSPTIEFGDPMALAYFLAAADAWTGRRIDQLYVDALRRTPDAEGRTYWVGLVAGGYTIESVGAFVHGSDEYYARSGGSDTSFLDALYEDLLGRPADPGGRAYWVAELSAGLPRSTVSAAFFDSKESRGARVDLLFEQILGRAPEQDARSHWMREMHLRGEIAVAAGLAATVEFWRTATGTEPPPRLGRGRGTGFERFATAGDVRLSYPAAVVEVVGYHQSGEDGARHQDPAPGRIPWSTMASRGRGNDRHGASDVVVRPDTEIRSPVTGTVLEARTYRLYCDYSDDLVVIEPDDHPGWFVRVLHIDGVQVVEGDRVVAGHTVIAPRATVLPFDSQVDDHAGSPPWPHVHIEVVDPTVPDRPPTSSCSP